MRGVTAEENAPAPELLRDPLVHVIEVKVQVTALSLWHVDAPEPRTHRSIGERFLVALVLARVVHRAPATLEIVARHLEEIGPFLRIGHVVAIATAERGGEIEPGGDDEETLGPGEALELDAKALPHDAATAVAA